MFIYKEHTIALSLLFLFIFTTPQIQAQRIWEEDVIYLQNGSELRGKIVDQKVGESVTIQLIDGSLLTFKTSEVSEIKREPSKYSRVSLEKNDVLWPVSGRKKGIYHMISYGLAYHTNEWGAPRLGPMLEYRIGYHLHKFLNVGLGTGINKYPAGLFVPAYLDINGDLSNKRITPHYDLNFGYGMAITQKWQYDVLKGGMMGQAAIGLKINTRRRSEFIFTVGFKAQDSYQEFQDWRNGGCWGCQTTDPIIIKGNRRFQRITLQFSYGF